MTRSRVGWEIHWPFFSAVSLHLSPALLGPRATSARAGRQVSDPRAPPARLSPALALSGGNMSHFFNPEMFLCMREEGGKGQGWGDPRLSLLQPCLSAMKSALAVDGGVPGRCWWGPPDAVKSVNHIPDSHRGHPRQNRAGLSRWRLPPLDQCWSPSPFLCPPSTLRGHMLAHSTPEPLEPDQVEKMHGGEVQQLRTDELEGFGNPALARARAGWA